MLDNSLLLGKYRHFRNGKLYEVIAQGIHSETREEMIIYKSLYDCEQYGKDQIWIRPKAMFFEHVVHNGKTVPRFEKLE
jgi:hypothetical protein